MKKKPVPLWVIWLGLASEVGIFGLICYGIWHNVKCAFGVH